MNKFLLHFVFLIFISLQTAGFSQIANEAILSIDSDELEYIRKDLSPWETAVYPSIIFDDQEFKCLKKNSNNCGNISFFDDGTNGDDVPGDSIYSLSVTINELIEGKCLPDSQFKPTFSNAVKGYGHIAGSIKRGRLLVIDSKQRGTVEWKDFGNGLMGTDYVLFYSLGDEYKYIYSEENWPLHRPFDNKTGKRVLKEFGDDAFDYLVFVPDKHFGGAGYVRIHDNIKGIMTYNEEPYYDKDKIFWKEYHGLGNKTMKYYDIWLDQNLSRGVIDTAMSHLAYKNTHNRLKGNIWYGGWNTNGLNHEFGHSVGIGPPVVDFPGNGLSWNSQDRMHINSSSTVSNVMTGPFWDPKRGWPNSVRVKDKQGVWKEVQIEANGDGTFTMVPRDPYKHERYDDILLYMLGFKSPEEANTRYYLFNEKEINLKDCFFQDDSKGEPLKATAGSKGLYCYDNIIDQSEYGQIEEFGVQEMIDMFGPRNPSYKKSSKHLNVGVIYLTKNQPTEAEIVWNHLKYEWWTTKNEWVPDIGATWSFVTRGLSTISTGVPKKITKR